MSRDAAASAPPAKKEENDPASNQHFVVEKV